MSQHTMGELDTILKGLIENPDQLDTVKSTLMGRMNDAGLATRGRRVSGRLEDDDDLFDNVPV